MISKTKEFLKKKKKGVSLIEVLVAMGIVSTAMIASVNVLLSSQAQQAYNLIEDSANSIMVKAMEVAKSPANIDLSEEIALRPLNSPIYFSLEGNNSLQLQSPGLLTDCSEASVYNSQDLVDAEFGNPLVCVQIIVVPRTGAGDRKIYELTSRVLYNLNTDTRSNELKGYRFTEF